MRQEIEIEFKNLLTKRDYEQLLNNYPFKEPIKQVNYYFETKDFAFREIKSALRIRKKKDKYTLTLKQPYKGHLLETHLSLTKEETMDCLKGNFVDKAEFTKHLASLGINIKDLVYLGELTTYRRTYVDEGDIYVLDHSLYNGIEDFEFELEVDHAEAGKSLFSNIMQNSGISLRKTPSKIERFFNSLPQ